MGEYVLFIIPIVGEYPTPVDPENPTQEEQDAIDAWQVRKDNADALYGKIENAEGWLLDGVYQDIINQDKYAEVSHPASPDVNGAANWFKTERIIGKDTYPGGASAWAENKISQLKETYTLKGWVTDDVYLELSSRNYSIVTGGA